MTKINSLDEFLNITKIANLKNLNCYLFPDEINSLSKNNQLYYEKDDSTLQIIVKYPRYNKIYFYGNENFNFIDFPSTLPIITDISYSNILKEKDEALKKRLNELGFVVNSSSSKMTSNNFDVDFEISNFTIEKINKSEIDTVYDIWEENFDPVENLLYDKKEILENLDSIFVLKNKKHILGCMQIILSRRFGMIQRIAIKKDYQGKGLGRTLESFYINYCKSLGITNLMLYTIDSNKKAQAFHKKFGFEFDGKHNIQLMLRR